jgi:hypothetical protein
MALRNTLVYVAIAAGLALAAPANAQDGAWERLSDNPNARHETSYTIRNDINASRAGRAESAGGTEQ